MKRLLLCVLLAGMLLLCAFPAVAENGKIHLEDLRLHVAVPEGFVVFTRETSSNDPSLQTLGIDFNELYRSFQQKSVYLSAVGVSPYTEINISMRSDDNTKGAESYKDMEAAALENLGAQFLALGEAVDGRECGFTGFSLYENEQAAYLVFDIGGGADGEVISGLQYQTIVNGQNVNFTMIVHAGALPAGRMEALRRMVDESEFSLQGTGASNTTFLLAAFGMLVIGGLTVYSALRRNKKLEKAHKRGSPRAAAGPQGFAFCPHCGVRMPKGESYCHACGEWTGNSR